MQEQHQFEPREKVYPSPTTHRTMQENLKLNYKKDHNLYKASENKMQETLNIDVDARSLVINMLYS